jgi:D-sedoheptulose 7-phosphate isomerase
MNKIRQSMQKALQEARSLLEDFHQQEETLDFLKSFCEGLLDIFRKEGRVFIAGNGGSHCDALHFAEEFTGRYRGNRRALPVMALGEASHVTCVGNDYGFEEIFSRQIEAFGREGDLLILLSTSGCSKNLYRALEKARMKNMKILALLGRDGGRLQGKADLEIIVPGKTSDRIQELQMMLLHIVIEGVERSLFPDHYT